MAGSNRHIEPLLPASTASVADALAVSFVDEQSLAESISEELLFAGAASFAFVDEVVGDDNDDLNVSQQEIIEATFEGVADILTGSAQEILDALGSELEDVFTGEQELDTALEDVLEATSSAAQETDDALESSADAIVAVAESAQSMAEAIAGSPTPPVEPVTPQPGAGGGDMMTLVGLARPATAYEEVLGVTGASLLSLEELGHDVLEVVAASTLRVETGVRKLWRNNAPIVIVPGPMPSAADELLHARRSIEEELVLLSVL